MRKLLCFAEGRDGIYEAICVDLDIAVQGRSFREVFDGLNDAVETYIQDATKEDEATARQLLSRRAPWHVRMGYVIRLLRHALGAGRKSDREEASFDVACPA
jgi:predicted RNase H-like HicB family nuclease